MEPSLDNWTTFFLLAASTGIFVSLVLLVRSKSASLFLVPAIIIGLFSLVLLQYVLFWTRYQTVIPYFIYLPNFLLGLIPVLVIRYSNRLLGRKPRRYTRFLYIPVLFGLLSNILYWLGVFQIESEASGLIWSLGNILFIGLNPWVVVVLYGFSAVELYRFQVPLEGPRRRYFKMMLGSLVLFAIAFASYFILVNFSFFNSTWDYAISIMMSGTIYFLGGTLIAKSTNQLFPEAKGSNQALLDEKSVDELFLELDQKIRKECHYRKDDLRLEWLAEKLNIPRNYLSYIINTKSGNNFNNFINEYRVKEAAELLISRTDLTVKDIYFQVGFNNKATFYQAFKRKYDSTPTEYRMSNKSNRIEMNGTLKSSALIQNGKGSG